MWIMTPFGVLMPCRIPPKHQNPKDPRTMQVRARRAKDLDILRALYMQGRLGQTLHTRDKDYEYRAYCTPEDLKIALCDMVDDAATYDKFKPETLRFEDWDLYRTYNKIWNVVMDELSTDEHRDEYFGKFKTVGTGYPTAVETVARGKVRVVDADAVDDSQRLDAWYRAHQDAGCEKHGGPVDWQLPAAGGDDDSFGNAVPGVAALSAEIEEIYARRHGYDDHRLCDHPAADSSDTKCRDARIREDDELIDVLRREIDTCYDVFITEILAEVGTDK